MPSQQHTYVDGVTDTLRIVRKELDWLSEDVISNLVITVKARLIKLNKEHKEEKC